MSRGKSHNRVARRDLMKLEKKSMQRRARQQQARQYDKQAYDGSQGGADGQES